MGDLDSTSHDQFTCINAGLCLLNLEKLCSNFGMVRDVDEVHSEDFHTSNLASPLQEVAHVLADVVAVVEEAHFGRVVASVAEFAGNASDYVVGLSVDEVPELLHIELTSHWVFDHVVDDRGDVHRGSS